MSDRVGVPVVPAVPTRRTVLQAVGLAALTGGSIAGLGACTAEEGSGTRSSAAPTPTELPASPAGSGSAASSSAPPVPRAQAASPSRPAVAAADVPVGGGVILNEADYVITQPTAGDFRGFSKFCTHQQCPLASVGGGMINCMCHGGRYSITDGSVQAGPPPKPLRAVEVAVTDGWVVVSD